MRYIQIWIECNVLNETCNSIYDAYCLKARTNMNRVKSVSVRFNFLFSHLLNIIVEIHVWNCTFRTLTINEVTLVLKNAMLGSIKIVQETLNALFSKLSKFPELVSVISQGSFHLFSFLAVEIPLNATLRDLFFTLPPIFVVSLFYWSLFSKTC